MSTIPSASPRPSMSSRRTSTSTATDTTTEKGSVRRNKAAALRDYYGIRSAQATDTPPRASLDVETESEIDRPSFCAATYVEKLLKEQDLAGALRVEASLVREVWGLDGERKALVYDNYSKLIGATETIKNMREKMETRRMETSTLTPAIAHIAESASTLSAELFKQPSQGAGNEADVDRKRRNEQVTVRWVLDAPGRIERLVEAGQFAEAEREWTDASSLLKQWEGVKGAEQVRQNCLQALPTNPNHNGADSIPP